MAEPLIVYSGQSKIILGDRTPQHEHMEIIPVPDKRVLYSALSDCFKQTEAGDHFITGYAMEEMVKDFKDYLTLVDAAGGLVRNQQGAYLFIKRYGLWDLPKGKLKDMESYEKGALREVKEETGVGELSITGKLPVSLHIYPLEDKMILKRTHWFAMETTFAKNPIPQTAEAITEASWLKPSEARSALSESYRSLSETLLQYIID
jgi:ADP-ribose pyrophosphatase YjhB (NUDIX family)